MNEEYKTPYRLAEKPDAYRSPTQRRFAALVEARGAAAAPESKDIDGRENQLRRQTNLALHDSPQDDGQSRGTDTQRRYATLIEVRRKVATKHSGWRLGALCQLLGEHARWLRNREG